MTGRRLKATLAVLGVAVLFVLSRGGDGNPVQVTIPTGATLPEVAELLASNDVVFSARVFQVYARVRRADRKLQAGDYEFTTGESMRGALRQLTNGGVITVVMTIPEGFQLRQMAPRIAAVTGVPEGTVNDVLGGNSMEARFGVPGPGIEGYLFPDTYRFAGGVPVSTVVATMVARYGDVWTPERRASLTASGMTEREVVTLASIIQAEASKVDEMPRISGVYHNRLEAGWRLQADPTVLYALGGYRARLLYAAIDSVEDNPYNTYANRGLPPGPIGSPGARAIDAALEPEVHDFMYFVAWPDGSHVFTRSLADHNAAKEGAADARENTGS
jgi:UPF0755 protein